jgi:MFS family permease
MHKENGFRLYSLAVIRGLQSASYAISIPFLNIYLYNVKHIPMTIVGTIIGAASIIGSFLRAYAGKLTDVYPSERIMKYGLFMRATGFLGFSALIWLNAPPALFFVFFLFNSAGVSFFMSASDTFIAKNIKEEDRPFAYSIIRVGGNLGFAIGPAIGGFISRYSYALTFFISFVIQIFCYALLIYSVSKKNDVENLTTQASSSFSSLLSDKNFMTFIFGTFVLSLLMGQLISTLSVFSKSRGLTNTQIGYLYSINGFMVVFLQLFVVQLIEKMGYKNGLILGSLLYALGYFSFSFASTFPSFALGVVILTLGEMLTMPLLTSIASIMAPEEKRGLYIGLLGFVEGIAWAIAPFIGGVLIDSFLKSPILIWGTVASLGILSIIVFLQVKFK